MKKLIFDLMDEAYDEGESLLFRKGRQEVRVMLRDIKNISSIMFMNPPRVTISLRVPTAFGQEITFSPPASIIPFRKNKDIEALIDRIDRARG